MQNDEQNQERHSPKRRRGRRRRRRAISYPLQLLGAAVAVAATLFVLVLVVEKAAHPYWLGHQVAQQVTTLKTRLHEQNQRNAALRQQVRYLESDEGAEVLARQNGYHRPGEHVVFVSSFPAPDGSAAEQTTPPRTSPQPPLQTQP